MVQNGKRLLVTGARGFLGKNLTVFLSERQGLTPLEFNRGDSLEALPSLVGMADAIIHLAGENRPAQIDDFEAVNVGVTRVVCDAIRRAGRAVPIIFTSSTQAALDNPYGRSKLEAERELEKLVAETGNPCAIYRLPGVFGKWCRPNYNSVVATFCHNIARDMPVHIRDPYAELRLVYVDDVIGHFLTLLERGFSGLQNLTVEPEYVTTVGDLAEQIKTFDRCRSSLEMGPVGTGLMRALYATYVSYFPTARFDYELQRYGDERGVFVEMLKTPDAGQFSYFTAHPGITRGSHYHHSKTEKFLVIKGRARFRFRHIVSNELYELFTSGHEPRVVDTIPGWVHDITNVGDEELVVMLWANEIFDRKRPDTIACKV